MPYYRVAGEIPRKRHVRFRGPAGNLYAEELMGEEGFVSDSSLLYHQHPPTAIVKSEGLTDTAGQAPLVPNHPLLPRHFRTQDMPPGGALLSIPVQNGELVFTAATSALLKRRMKRALGG